jgi:sulfur-oxidizing protein SoxY
MLNHICSLHRLLTVVALLLIAPVAAASWERVTEIQSLLDGREPERGAVRLQLPLVSEDGARVDMTVSVDHPMNADSYVRAIHVFAPGNPTPELASFFLSPMLAEASVTSRIRLNESQTVVAIAELSDGRALVGEHEIRITVSGCLTRNGNDAQDSMQTPRIGLPRQLRSDRPVDVRTMIDHPMETGLREGDDGNLLPENIVERLIVTLNDDKVIEARLFRAVSANPYVRFPMKAQSGDLVVSWHEDTGREVSEKRSLRL